jgi:hypothetical protein
VNTPEFERAAGVGVVITEEDVQRVVNRLFDESSDDIKANGHNF